MGRLIDSQAFQVQPAQFLAENGARGLAHLHFRSFLEAFEPRSVHREQCGASNARQLHQGRRTEIPEP